MRVGKRLRLASGSVLVMALLTVTLLLAGCGSTPSNQVDMGVAAFQQTSVSIKAGQAVHYAFGTLMGAIYGVSAELVPEVTTGGGTAYNPDEFEDIAKGGLGKN